MSEEEIKVDGIKCMLVGDSKVGKTWLYRRLLGQSEPKSEEEYSPTVFDINNKIVTWNGKGINLTLWDSAGSSFYDSIRPISYAHVDCFLLCYAVDDMTSYRNVEERWLPEIARHGDGPRVPIILLATKSDLSHSSASEGEMDGLKLKEKVKARAFFRVDSGMSGEKVEEIMRRMVELACMKKIEEEKPPDPNWKFQFLNVIVTGDAGVGKSSVIEACLKEPGQQTRRMTNKHNYKLQEYYHDFSSNGCEYFLRIIELPLGAEYSATLHELCQQTDLILLIYAINDPFSFQSVDENCRIVMDSLSKNVPIILIGNKSDLKESSLAVIPTEDGEELKGQMNCRAFIEVSAKSSDRIPKIFQSLVDIFKNDSSEAYR